MFSLMNGILRKLGIFKLGRIRYMFPTMTLLLLILFGALAIVYFEQGVNDQFTAFSDGIWWAVVTITTVGYGDKFPVTLGGRIIALVVMLGGIGTFAYIAGVVFDDLLKKGRGLMPVKYNNHYIICNYSFKAKSIVEELLNHNKNLNIVLVAERDENPLNNGTLFVKGEPSDEAVLKKANVEHADTVIVVADGKMDEKLADAQSVLATLTIRHLNPKVKIIAEVLDPTNYQHFRRAGADDIISSGEISSSLIVRASLFGSGSKAIRELITNRFGSEIYDIDVKEQWIGKTFGEVFQLVYKKGYLPIGLARGDSVLTNPAKEEILQRGDKLIYIGEDCLELQ